MKYYLYVLNCSDKSYYTGITTDLNRRLFEHNNSASGAKYTKARRPVALVYSKSYPDRASATKAEIKLKQLTRQAKQKLIAGFNCPT